MVTLPDLLERVRALNVDALASAVKEEPEAFVEPAFRCEDGSLAVEGPFDLPLRADLVQREGDHAGDSVMVDPPRMVTFESLSFRIEQCHLSLEPFGWDNALVVARPLTLSAVTPLRDWFLRWFDPEDEAELHEDGLYHVVHFLSDPEEADGALQFIVDFGSAPVDAFDALIDTLITQGATHIAVSHSPH
ncbi:MAG: hypothetical protein R3B07_35830 [Polyangiaceae bacterium]